MDRFILSIIELLILSSRRWTDLFIQSLNSRSRIQKMDSDESEDDASSRREASGSDDENLPDPERPPR